MRKFVILKSYLYENHFALGVGDTYDNGFTMSDGDFYYNDCLKQEYPDAEILTWQELEERLKKVC